MNWVTTIHNHPQLPTTTHNHPQPLTTTQKTIQNYPKAPIMIYNQPQPAATTQKLPKETKTCHMQLFYCTLDANTEDVDFGSDMKQWYIYMYVCVGVCVYIFFRIDINSNSC